MRVLIVEDEPPVARRLARLLHAQAGGEITDLATASTLAQAAERIARGDLDVVFLDLNLHGRDGFDLLTASAAGAFHTVVVSAHTDRALRAFEVGVLDFVPKPFGAERIRATLDRIRGARAAMPATSLAIRSAGRIDLVPVADVLFVQAAGAYSELVLRDGTRQLHDKSLDRLLAVLPLTFERVHRSYAVRLDEVVRLRVREGSRYAAVLASGEEVPVGRTRYKTVRDRLAGG
ncbi:LytR/AlgR family response regulator transcription factor [Rubrivirga sp. IMCC43871]|uniref:LytR/AlgR family response regulator transcription factor n=1 Tax=Rubrivirga sp. IMCC43871 TaxID=3391575 RepID=UPI0039900367